MISELERTGVLDGALAIWSLWRGYLANPTEQRMQHVLASRGVPLEVHHVSGHAHVRDLQCLADAVRAERVIPIHTTNPMEYAAQIADVELMPDGRWWQV